jgi:hypothetical protein
VAKGATSFWGLGVGFETGVAAIGAAIERMRDQGVLCDEDLAVVVAALHDNVGPDTAFVADPLVRLTSQLADRI